MLAQKTNFAPRIGFAYQALPRLVLRGGYGLFFQGNENHGLSVSNYINFPFQVTTSFAAGKSGAHRFRQRLSPHRRARP